jgi:brefeldin A-resistance guanine nucleotide exchange factor 1
LTKEDVDKLLAQVKENGSTGEPTVNLEPSKPEPEQEIKEESRKSTETLVPVPVEAEFEQKTSLESKVSVTEEDQTPPSFTPHGLPTILELLRVLIALLNPSDQAHTDSMRLSALAILNTALEVGGSTLGKWPELREGLLDEGCRYLFQVSTLCIEAERQADMTSSPDPTRQPCCPRRCVRHLRSSLQCCHTSNYSLSFSCPTSLSV